MSDRAVVAIRPAAAADLATVRALFVEYARSLSFDLCFQNFEQELAGLPGKYAPPGGCILLAESGAEALGMIALRPLEPGICEMKRLYVRPPTRGAGLGARLARAVIAEAEKLGYREMRLDTHETMQAAIGLYKALGFAEIPAYGDDAVPGLHYFGCALRQ